MHINSDNILIYFESIVMQCITYIMTLHKANFVFSGKVRKQTNIISNFQIGHRLIPETGRGNYLYDQAA